MSDRKPVPVDLSVADSALLNVTMIAVGQLFDGEVIGLIVNDRKGIFIAPKPGLALRLFKFLATVNWEREKRIAEEHGE